MRRPSKIGSRTRLKRLGPTAALTVPVLTVAPVLTKSRFFKTAPLRGS
jgi:hypothetical protein